jgi:hypothetical protein
MERRISMGQQFGDGRFDFDRQQLPAGIRPYDPDISEVAHHVAIVSDVLDLVEHAVLQLKHCVIDDQWRQKKNAGR